jgi:hypothetical protein
MLQKRVKVRLKVNEGWLHLRCWQDGGFDEEVIRKEETKTEDVNAEETSEETAEAKPDEIKMDLEPLSQSTRGARPRLKSLMMRCSYNSPQ